MWIYSIYNCVNYQLDTWFSNRDNSTEHPHVRQSSKMMFRDIKMRFLMNWRFSQINKRQNEMEILNEMKILSVWLKTKWDGDFMKMKWQTELIEQTFCWSRDCECGYWLNSTIPHTLYVEGATVYREWSKRHRSLGVYGRLQ
jgi:hypothetical protein